MYVYISNKLWSTMIKDVLQRNKRLDTGVHVNVYIYMYAQHNIFASAMCSVAPQKERKKKESCLKSNPT